MSDHKALANDLRILSSRAFVGGSWDATLLREAADTIERLEKMVASEDWIHEIAADAKVATQATRIRDLEGSFTTILTYSDQSCAAKKSEHRVINAPWLSAEIREALRGEKQGENT